MSTVSKYLIYALVDPRDGAWRYVGKSSSGLTRPRSHKNPSALKRKGNPHKCNWIRKLQGLGLGYEIEVLEELNSPDGLDEAEREWIAQARATIGVDLINKDDGGTGRTPGFTASPETRAKMSVARRAWKNTPAQIAAASEHCRKLSEQNRGRNPSAETRARMARSATGRKDTPETTEKRRIAHTGKKHTPETKAKLSAGKLGKPRSLESVLAQSRRMGGKPFVDESGTVYQTQRSASRALNVSQADVSKVLRGQHKQASGHTFRYLETA